MELSTIITLILIGLFAGILSGMIGIGGGILIVPALVFILGLSQTDAQGTSIFIMLPPIGIMAAINYYKESTINWKYAIIIAFFFIFGGYLGSKATLTFISESVSKKIFGIILIFISIKMIFFSK